MFVATGTYRIERGTTSNKYGDETDAATVVATKVPLAVSEKTVSGWDGSNRVRTREIVGRGRTALDLREGDRVIDEKTGERFTVTGEHRTGGTGMMGADVVVDMVRTSPIDPTGGA